MLFYLLLLYAFLLLQVRVASDLALFRHKTNALKVTPELTKCNVISTYTTGSPHLHKFPPKETTNYARERKEIYPFQHYFSVRFLPNKEAAA